jgi:hypothetical protein
MKVNLYTQLPVAQYNPMSMQELAIAPTYLRERHDAVQSELGDLDIKSNQYDVLDEFNPVANQVVQPFQKNISELAEKLAKEGVQRSKGIPEAMKLKSQYQQLFGQQGYIGQLQGRTNQYREAVKQIQEQFKGHPEIIKGALARLNAGEATIDANGKLQLTGMQTPTLYRHIKDEDIMKQLNDATKALKASDLGDLGIRKGQIDNFNDLITASSAEGVSADRILGVMYANLGPEAKNSILQYSEFVDGIPRNAMIEIETPSGAQAIPAGLASFYQRMQTSANAQAYKNVSRQRFMVKDDVKVHAAKNLMDAAGFDALELPGAPLQTQSKIPFMEASYKNGKFNIPDKVFSHTRKYIRESDGKVVNSSEATFKVATPSGNLTSVRPGYKETTEGLKEAEDAFLQLKENTPTLRNLSKEQALKVVQEHYKNLGQMFGSKTVFNKNFNFVENSLKGSLTTSDFYDGSGQKLNFRQLAKQHGVTEEALRKSFKASGIGVRPKIGGIVEATITNSRNQIVDIFMQPDYRSRAVTETTSAIIDYLYNGGATGEVDTKYIDPNTKKPIFGVRTYVVNDYKNPPLVIYTSADLDNNSVKSLNGKTKEEIAALFEPGSAKIVTATEANLEAVNSMREYLQTGR